jgi:hypothetical protein
VAWDSDILSAIDWSIKVKNNGTYNVCAINLSLGSASNAATPCATSAYESSFATARRAGIVPAVASGNDAKKNAIASPACAPSAVSVGAVYDSNVNSRAWSVCTDASTAADQVACFSNSAAYLTLLAPGAIINAGGWSMAGTSQATPHVSGAVAVLKAAVPTATVAQVIAALQSSGKLVTDAANGVSTSRIDVAAAVAALSSGGGGVGANTDTTAPTGSVSINGGAAISASLDVTLAISGTDASGVASMCISNTAAACTAFETFATTKAWRLAAGADGVRTVFVTLKDTAGNTMATPATDTITLQTTQADNTPPTGSVTINGGAATTTTLDVTLAISGNDASGVASMCISNTAAACTAFQAFATTKAWQLAGGADGVRTVFVTLKDTAGNTMATPASATITLQTLVAAGTSAVVINGGTAYTNARTVPLQISAQGATSKTKMCISQTAADASGCGGWSGFAASKKYSLGTSPQGLRTIRVFFRDASGAALPTAVGTISFDSVAPSMDPAAMAVTATPTSSSVIVGFLQAATDDVSGVASYVVVGRQGKTAPPRCSGASLKKALSGGLASTVAAPTTPGTDGVRAAVVQSQSVSFSGLKARTSYSFRVCALDTAGNAAQGVTVSTSTTG